MQDGKVSERDIELHKEMLALIENRKYMYGSVRVTTAFKKDVTVWKNVLTKFEILAKDDLADSDKFFNYGDFTIRQNSITLGGFLTTLDQLINRGELAIPNSLTFPVEGSLQKDYTPSWHYHPSNDQTFLLRWPANVFIFQVTNNYKTNPPGDPLVALDQPLFDDGYAAMESIIGVGRNNAPQYLGSIVFLFPNFIAKISQVKIGTKELTLAVSVKEAKLDELIAKISCGWPPQTYHTDVEFDGNQATVHLDFSPNFYTIYLLSRRTGEVLDYRRFGLGWRNLTSDIVIAIAPEDIEQLIRRGENEEVEFKQEFPKNWENFAEAVVAFANTRGGTILLGVEDNGNVIGVKDQKVEDTIQNILRTYTEPPVAVTVAKPLVQNETILVVYIKEGENKPYTIRGKGVFVRAGSTNRIATRDELDAFYGQRFPRAV